MTAFWNVLKSDRMMIAALCGLLAMRVRQAGESDWWMWIVLSVLNITLAVLRETFPGVRKKAS